MRLTIKIKSAFHHGLPETPVWRASPQFRDPRPHELPDERRRQRLLRLKANRPFARLEGRELFLEHREASQLAQMNQIAPGKRVRGNIEKWASSTVSLRGGRLETSAAHPDAGKVWSFGSYRQRLTDCVNFKNALGEPTTIRLTGATDARTFRASTSESVDLWVFSAAVMEARGGDPRKIQHSELIFDYLVDATPLAAECPEATGREIPATELPYVNPSSASLGVVAGERRLPPDSIFCWMAAFLLGGSTKG